MRHFWMMIMAGCMALTVTSQEPYCLNLTTTSGLSNNSVYDLLQDRKGYLWVASDDGISRYDGVGFQNFSNEHQTSRPGSNLTLDVYGRLWYQNFDGYLYYVQEGEMRRFAMQQAAGFFGFGASDQHLFVFERAGSYLNVYDLKTLTKQKSIMLKKYGHIIRSAQTPIGFMFSSEKGVFYVDKYLSLRKFNPRQLNISPSTYYKRTERGVLFLLSEKNQKRLIHYLANGETEQIPLPDELDFQNLSITPSAFWLCTPRGAYRVDRKQTKNRVSGPYFKTYNISSVLEDREDNLWISTVNQGILYVPDLNLNLCLNDYPINALVKSNNAYLASTGNNQILELAASFTSESSKPKVIWNKNDNREIIFLKEDPTSGKILFASPTFEMIDQQGARRSEKIAIKDMCRLASGCYAFAASGCCGIYCFDGGLVPKKLQFSELKKHEHFQDFYTILEEVRGKAVCYDSVINRIYFATNNGLFLIEKGKSSEIKRNNKPVYLTQLACSNGVVYGLTSAGEILTLDRNKTWKPFLKQAGIRDSRVKRIKIQDDRMLVLYSNQIEVYDLSNARSNPMQEIQSYGLEILDALIEGSQILMVTNKGVLIEDVKANKRKGIPILDIQRILVNGERISLPEMLRLQYEQNQIEFRYAVLSFKSDFNHPLFYRINEGTWIQLSPQNRSLLLSALAPGSYRIEFHLGDLKSKQAILKAFEFNILQPWYWSWWAKSVYGLAVIVLFYLIYRNRIQSIQRKNRLSARKMLLEKQVSESKLKSIRSQMNPHFFFNALNTIQSYIYANDKSNASAYLSKFSKLTRIILEMSEKEWVSLEEECAALTLYMELEQKRFNDDFQFELALSGIPHPELLKIPSLLVQPYIENAIKHGLLHRTGKKILHVSFNYSEQGVLTIQIEDNGIGREASFKMNRNKHKHQSFASEANQKRIDILNEGTERPITVRYTDLKDEYEKALGTRVMIKIPI